MQRPVLNSPGVLRESESAAAHIASELFRRKVGANDRAALGPDLPLFLGKE